MTLDISLFHLINSAIGQSAILDGAVIFFARYAIVIVLIVFCTVAIRSHAHRLKNLFPFAVALFSAFIARFVIASGIRFLYHRPRPFAALDAPYLFTDSAFSFPSGHTIFLFSLAAATYRLNKRLAYFIGIAAVVIGVARIAAGVHYPSDILGGAVLGILVGITLQRFFDRFILPRMSR